MDSSATAPAPAPAPVQISQPARIVNAFVAPSKAFRGLERNASWWMAWLLMSIVSLAFVWVVDTRIGMDEIARIEMAKNSRQAAQMEKMSPEQRQKATQLGGTIARVTSYAVPVSILIVSLIIAAILMATFNFGFGAEVPFKVALAIVFYGCLPNLIASLLAIASLVLGANPEGFNIRNPIASNPAYFMDASAHKFLYGLVSAVDIFSLWCVVLLGIGFSCQSKVKRSTAILTIFSWFLLYKVGSAAIAALS